MSDWAAEAVWGFKAMVDNENNDPDDNPTITVSKDDLRYDFDNFMREQYPEVAKGPMCDEKNEYYTRLGIFYHFTDTLFEHDTGE